MIRGVGIERQVVRAFVGLMAVAALFYTGFVMLVAYIVEDEIIDRLLSDEVRYLQEGYAKSGTLPDARLGFVQVYSSLAQAPRPVADKLAQTPQRREIFTNDERHFHVRYLFLSDQSRPLVVAEVSSLLVVSNMSRRLLLLLVTVLALLVGVALWLAYRIARRTTRPIVQLKNEVQRGQNTGDALTLTSAGQAGEVGYLADVIESSFNQLRDAVDREHNFTRDVSHELRTPLTVMKNTLSLMTQRPTRQDDIDLLRGAAHSMQATVTALLGLAREESAQLANLRLRPILENCVLSLDAGLQQADFQIDLSVADSVEVPGNAHLVSLLVTNLIENAVQYASEPRLEILLEGRSLRFANAVAKPVTGDLTSPTHKSAHSQGLGQGLFLVKRIAEALHWRLSTQTDANVFCVTLELPPST